MIRMLVRLGLLLGLVAAAGLVFRSFVDVIDISAIGGGPLVQAERRPDDVTSRAVAPLAALQDTRERPLFSPDRRPVQAPVAVEDGEPADGLTLIGLMRPEGKAPRALIRVDGQNSAVWIGVGGSAGGAIVREVRPGVVIVERGGRLVPLRLRPTRTAADAQ